MMSMREVDLKAVEKNRFLKIVLDCLPAFHLQPPPSSSGIASHHRFIRRSFNILVKIDGKEKIK
jgi:hypothetical protein